MSDKIQKLHLSRKAYIYTRGVWDLGVNVRPIYFMARRNDE